MFEPARTIIAPGPFIVSAIMPSVPPPEIAPLKVVEPPVGARVNTAVVLLALLMMLPPPCR